MSKYQESIVTGTQAIRSMWMRQLQVTFTSKINPKLSVTIGDNASGTDYNITVSGKKLEGCLEDGGTVSVYNMEPDALATIVSLELFKVEIKFGYKSDGSMITFAKGEVSYISQRPHARHDTVTYISYAAEAIAAKLQKRVSLSFNSGINAWTMMNYLVDDKSAVVSDSLKTHVYNQIKSAYDKGTTVLSELTQETGMGLQVDSSLGSLLTISDISERRVLPISPDLICIQNGNPTVTASGLSIDLFPVFNYIPGDIIKIDNGIIDLSQGTTDYASIANVFNSAYIDKNGQYVIREIDYTFQNRDSVAKLTVKARALSLVLKEIGA